MTNSTIRLLRLFCVSVICFALVMYTLAALTARGGVFDDVWGIQGIPYHVKEVGLLSRLGQEWTRATYDVATDGRSMNHAPWGPLTASLWDMVAAGFGRESMVPFRLLNVGVFALLLLGVYQVVSRSSGSSVIGYAAAAGVAVHPLTVETVPWSSDLFDLLGVTITVWGFNLLARCRTHWHIAAVVFCCTVLAGFAKPMGALLGLYFGVVLMIWRRERRQVVLAWLVSVVGITLHQSLYAIVTSVSGSVLRDALVIACSDKEHATTFFVQLGVQIIQLVAGFGPRVSRMVYAEDTWAPSVAVIAYTSLAVVLLFFAIGTIKGVWSRCVGAVVVILLVLWVAENIPGVLYGMRQKGIGVRYCFMPAVVMIVCLAMALRNVQQSFAALRLRPVYGHVLVLLPALAIVSWGNAALDRLPVWQSEGTYLDAELRLNAEWQKDGKPHPEYEATYRFLRLLAVTQGREAFADDTCAHLARWEAATAEIERSRRLVYVDNTMEMPRAIVWEYVFAHGRCTTLDRRMRDKLVLRGVPIP